MAVFQGARLRRGPLPAGRAPAARAPAARVAARLPTAGAPAATAGAGARATARTAARVRPIGLLMAGILAATILGLVYLTQTLGANATDSEIRKLSGEREKLEDTLRRQAVWVQTFTDSEEITKLAKKAGLRSLGDIVVLPAP